MTVHEVAQGILRLSPSTQRRLMRHIERLLRRKEQGKQVRRRTPYPVLEGCDPIYSIWEARLSELSHDELRELRSLVATSMEPLQAPTVHFTVSNLTLEDFKKARRAVWRSIVQENET